LKKTIFRTFSLLLALLLVFSGCAGNPSNGSTAPSTQPKPTEYTLEKMPGYNQITFYWDNAKGKDLAKERKNWVEENLGADAGGLALFPNTYTNIQQIQSTARIVDADQVKLIQDRVHTYFNTNEKILHNEASGDDWSAYYEGKIEPFAIQLSQAMTAMTYSHQERARKNGITWSANRLQYLSNADKLQTSTQLFDRAILSTNMVMDIWNLPHVPDGDKRYIRKEYIEISQLDDVTKLQEELKATQAQVNTKPKPEPEGTEEPKEDENDPE
jgi:hypothetical protein